ncbi:hypothetical protein M409DRAFT_48610 [Zasmidium cellare ATCC 36951]|uniref:SnoaL-like domain-containing protein n=1 Tax=Zasmidium cellare ATCC 36951 TaxID=1080233 RepID=A0A6A6D2N0_ZASCE|nr:uncharacterized protein M409DRAFT_48610 [Zasmidium cellare ATCC 36951]KAF2173667.1 hypothetical protein M409DRAFT_48610 [Zasmidium cellare ATCC 36951]
MAYYDDCSGPLDFPFTIFPEVPIIRKSDRLAKKPARQGRKELAVAAQLERADHEIMEAFNRRNFDHSGEVWQQYEDKFRVEVYMFLTSPQIQFNGDMTRREYLLAAEDVLSNFPDIRFYCQNRTSTVDVRAGRAKITSYSRFQRNAKGCLMDVLSVFDFRLTDGKWKIYRAQSFQGMDLLGIDTTV